MEKDSQAQLPTPLTVQRVCGQRAVANYNLPGHEGWNAVTWFKSQLSWKTICEMKED